MKISTVILLSVLLCPYLLVNVAAQICPDGSFQVNCLTDPCTGTTCPGVEGASCMADYCGGCNHKYMKNGTDVSDQCFSYLCPIVRNGTFGTCTSSCNPDSLSSCADGLVCCSNGCGTVCMQPVHAAVCMDSSTNTTYQVGDSFTAPDGCNTCICSERGFIGCTRKNCPRCSYNDQTYATGESFASIDGCNKCFCTKSGLAVCTLRACITNICSLRPDAGPCRAAIPAYHFNKTSGKCEKFTYGGCRGNENKFSTIGDCRKKCDPTSCSYSGGTYISGESFNSTDGCNRCSCSSTGVVICTLRACDVCSLPSNTGPCRAAIRSFHYNRVSRRCEAFTYGGCHGNGNRFSTIEDCQRRCDPTSCSYNNKAYLTGESFPSDDGCNTCSCRGNRRVICTFRACITDVCSLPLDAGPCRAAIPAYHFNLTSKNCEMFTYGGCQGNRNRFSTIGDCLRGCKPKRCSYNNMIHGVGESFASIDGCNRCSCTGNGIVICTLRACGTDVCSLPSDAGPCRASIPAYHFNQISQSCEGFTYGGCHGNGNRFTTMETCELRCNRKRCSYNNQTYLSGESFVSIDGCNTCSCSETGRVLCTLRSCEIDICSLSPDVGRCRAYIPSYYFNQTMGRCERFIYGGCSGNGNRFSTNGDCLRRCSPTSCSYNDRTYVTGKSFVSTDGCNICSCSETGIVFCTLRACGTDVCSLLADPGPCRAAFPAYHFNQTSGRCEQFIYGGCQGNGNKFATIRDCRERCKPLSCSYNDKSYVIGESFSSIDDCNTCSCSENGIVICTLRACGTDVCSLPRYAGPCRAAIPAYYFNQNSRRCEKFLYGGCQDNGNKFDTLENCQRRCGPSSCSYNNSTYISGQSFASIDGCNTCSCSENGIILCTLSACGTDICSLPPDSGLCLAAIPAYHFNSTSGRCEKFIYGGCQGNENNFKTIGDCLRRCNPTSCNYKDKTYVSGQSFDSIDGCNTCSCSETGIVFCTLRACGTDVCSLLPDAGPCRAAIPAYYFNQTSGSCEKFIYGGCHGNGNKFATTEDCSWRCNPTRCSYNNRTYVPGESFTSFDGCNRCSCSENGVIFCTLRGCGNDVCSLLPDAGPCRAAIQSFHFNQTSGTCEEFTYGGCRGNGNRFSTIGECLYRCDQTSCSYNDQTYVTGQSFASIDGCNRCSCSKTGVVICTLRGCDIDICSLLPDSGPCRAAFPAYHFNQTSGRCEEFVYGGCGGNRNKFATRRECKGRCGSKSCSYNDRTYASGQSFASIDGCNTCSCSVTGIVSCTLRACITDVCTLPLDAGPCRAAIPAYHFSQTSGRCEKFTYGGCRGNGNKFATSEDCLRRCDPTSLCLENRDPGRCRAYFPSYHFNSSSSRCEQFVYGGCGGNRNRFETLQSCSETCSPKTKPFECPSTTACTLRACTGNNELVRDDQYCCPYCRPIGRRCTSNEYTCSNGQCINRDRVCDGLSDCQDGGEERGCIQECEFRCSDGTCIPNSEVCDSILDCPGGKDVQNCSTMFSNAYYLTYRNIPLTCPDVRGTVGYCVGNCGSDSECVNDEKCCSNNCGAQTCMTGIQPVPLCPAIRSQSEAMGLLGRFSPECQSDGSFEEVQCQENYCWCVDVVTGQPASDGIPGRRPQCEDLKCKGTGGVMLSRGQSQRSADGCNNCICAAGGVLACTRKACLTAPCQLGRIMVSSNTTHEDDCNICRCLGGSLACTKKACAVSARILQDSRRRVQISLPFSGVYKTIVQDKERFKRQIMRSFLTSYGDSLGLIQEQIDEVQVKPGSIIVALTFVDSTTATEGANTTILLGQIEQDFENKVLIIRYDGYVLEPTGTTQTIILDDNQPQPIGGLKSWQTAIIVIVVLALLLAVAVITVIALVVVKKRPKAERIKTSEDETCLSSKTSYELKD